MKKDKFECFTATHPARLTVLLENFSTRFKVVAYQVTYNSTNYEYVAFIQYREYEPVPLRKEVYV